MDVTFNNIEEIKFTRIKDNFHDNLYSVSIKSDAIIDKESFENTLFECKKCLINSELIIKQTKEYVYSDIVKAESFEIPMNVSLLYDVDSDSIYNINLTE